jgi:hypothetical protein
VTADPGIVEQLLQSERKGSFFWHIHYGNVNSCWLQSGSGCVLKAGPYNCFITPCMSIERSSHVQIMT